ncbi:MAG: hypothetical protein AB8G23_04630 [Myxococcota bacterium]
MMRRHEVQNRAQLNEQADGLNRRGSDRALDARPRVMLTLLAVLSLALMFASRAALAETAELVAAAAPPASLAPAGGAFPQASADFTAPPVGKGTVVTARIVPLRDLEPLLAVRATPPNNPGQDADATIAAAVAEGSRPDLEPRKPFRKKNFDLFRTEHEVQIMRNDMLLRLRLRAKSRETMSVELRF